MDVPSDDEIRKTFEFELRAPRTQFVFDRRKDGSYQDSRLNLLWSGFLLGYSCAFERYGLSQPTFTVTPDARERAEAYQSVNPDYPSPATYLEAE